MLLQEGVFCCTYPRPSGILKATAPEVSLSDDARFVLRAEHVLRQVGWRGDPFLGVKLVDPAWTRARWDQAQAALAQWQRQQGESVGQAAGWRREEQPLSREARWMRRADRPVP